MVDTEELANRLLYQVDEMRWRLIARLDNMEDDLESFRVEMRHNFGQVVQRLDNLSSLHRDFLQRIR